MLSNAKTIIWLVCLCSVSVIGVYAYNQIELKPETTMRDECFSGSIDACVSLDKTNKQLYKDLENTQNQIAENNKVIKEHTQKLLSGSSFQ